MCARARERERKRESVCVRSYVQGRDQYIYIYIYEVNDEDKRKASVKDAKANGFSEICEILTNPHYICSVAGQTLNCFAMGAIIDWYTVFLLRYVKGSSIALAGLALSASSVVGGIGGTILGAVLVEKFKGMKSPSYFICGLGQIVGGALIFVAMGMTGYDN